MASISQTTERRRSLKSRPNKDNVKKDQKRMAANLAILAKAAPSGKAEK